MRELAFCGIVSHAIGLGERSRLYKYICTLKGQASLSICFGQWLLTTEISALLKDNFKRASSDNCEKIIIP